MFSELFLFWLNLFRNLWTFLSLALLGTSVTCFPTANGLRSSSMGQLIGELCSGSPSPCLGCQPSRGMRTQSGYQRLALTWNLRACCSQCSLGYLSGRNSPLCDCEEALFWVFWCSLNFTPKRLPRSRTGLEHWGKPGKMSLMSLAKAMLQQFAKFENLLFGFLDLLNGELAV